MHNLSPNDWLGIVIIALLVLAYIVYPKGKDA